MPTRISAGVGDHPCFLTMIPTDCKITNFSLNLKVTKFSDTLNLAIFLHVTN